MGLTHGWSGSSGPRYATPASRRPGAWSQGSRWARVATPGSSQVMSTHGETSTRPAAALGRPTARAPGRRPAPSRRRPSRPPGAPGSPGDAARRDQVDHAGDHDVGGPDRGQRVDGDEDGETGLSGEPLDEPPVPVPQLAEVRAAVEEHETSGRAAPWGDLVQRPAVGADARDDVHPPAEAGRRLVGRGPRAQGGHRCPGGRARRILLVGAADARRIPDQAAGETHR